MELELQTPKSSRFFKFLFYHLLSPGGLQSRESPKATFLCEATTSWNGRDGQGHQNPRQRFGGNPAAHVEIEH